MPVKSFGPGPASAVGAVVVVSGTTTGGPPATVVGTGLGALDDVDGSDVVVVVEVSPRPTTDTWFSLPATDATAAVAPMTTIAHAPTTAAYAALTNTASARLHARPIRVEGRVRAREAAKSVAGRTRFGVVAINGGVVRRHRETPKIGRARCAAAWRWYFTAPSVAASHGPPRRSRDRRNRRARARDAVVVEAR